MQQQGHTRGNNDAGNDLLNNAKLDLRSVDTHLGPSHVVNAIRDGNPNAKAGPNGVNGVPYHRFTKEIVGPFLEAVDDLSHGVPLTSSFTEGF